MEKSLLNTIYFSLLETDSILKSEENLKEEYALLDMIGKLYDDGRISYNEYYDISLQCGNALGYAEINGLINGINLLLKIMKELNISHKINI
ncbi:MAG: hypothetical protein Q4D26_04970 [Clostridia bacterium]|nr:hypothetical protein [Clostridia bacterium]